MTSEQEQTDATSTSTGIDASYTNVLNSVPPEAISYAEQSTLEKMRQLEVFFNQAQPQGGSGATPDNVTGREGIRTVERAMEGPPGGLLGLSKSMRSESTHTNA